MKCVARCKEQRRAAAAYVALLEQAGIEISMSRPGNPYDNAFCESFIGKLKQEQWDGRGYASLADARAALHTMVEEVYNQQRLHSALGYRTPEEYERMASASSRSFRQSGDGVQASLRRASGSAWTPPPPCPTPP